MSVLLLTMGPQLGITADLPVVGVGGAGVIRFRPIGAVGPVKWALVDSTLPAEWDSALNPDGNAVTLTTSDAETPGTFRVTVRAVDSARIPVVRSFDVRVMALPLTISGAFPNWQVSAPATGALTISGGVPPYSGLSITSGALPDGVSLSIVGNQIVPSGSPTVIGAWAATIGVVDSEGSPAQIYVSGEVTGDPYAEYVSALLHFNGADGSTTFTDETGKSWVPSGNAQIDTAQSKFGGASLLLDGVDDDIRHASHADFGFGTGDFTWECFVRRANGNCVIFDNRTGGNDLASIVAFIDPSGNLGFHRTATDNGTGSGATVPATTWTHVAWCRSSGTLRMFIGGIMVSATSMTSDMGSSRPMRIGRDIVNNADYSGHIDELRITKGIARYTGNFTPPAEPYPNP